ncbi:MAG: thiamine pyrophosphate-binding protein [Deltaproteobacteria bacterium]|nr:thiamine pyrophosphate-binding protein [Deltaproteobacteria bacterium]
MSHPHGGSIIGELLAKQGVTCLYTLCGGHISPILVGAKAHGITVVDVRDEVTAAFAADAASRMTGVPGVAAVTAGPGVTNTITAVKNAQMAQQPLVIFGGATATILRGRGSLQDIDQMSTMATVTKWAARISKVGEIVPFVNKAFRIAKEGVPGPVFLEVPVDLLYPEGIVEEWYLKESGVEAMKGAVGQAAQLAMKGYLKRQFHMPHIPMPEFRRAVESVASDDEIAAVVKALAGAKQPALVIGSQAVVNLTPAQADALADAVRKLGLPTFLGGSARGLLGRTSDLQFRHKRSKALREADVVIVAGFPFDFRMGYGQKINKKAELISANLDKVALKKNRKPDQAVLAHPGQFLMAVADKVGSTPDWSRWFATLQEREDARDGEIAAKAKTEGPLVDPVHLFQRIEEKLDDDSILIVDGGDFVATGAYIVRPRKPLSWLDPGVFGTLGVGGGFAVGAASVRPKAEVWLFYGDGSSAYSLAEFDTYKRLGYAPIAVIGTDASWQQIARDQKTLLGDLVGTELLRTDYHDVAEGYGGKGILLTDPAKIDEVLDEAKKLAKAGTAVCINVHLAASDFREGSISI